MQNWLVEVDFGWQHHTFCIGLEKDMRQRGSKVGAVKSVGRLGDVELFALGAVDLHSVLAQFVAHAVGDDALFVTERAWAVSIRILQVSSVHKGKTFTGPDVSRMQHSVQITRVLVQMQKPFILQLLLGRLVFAQHKLKAFSDSVAGEI